MGINFLDFNDYQPKISCANTYATQCNTALHDYCTVETKILSGSNHFAFSRGILCHSSKTTIHDYGKTCTPFFHNFSF